MSSSLQRTLIGFLSVLIVTCVSGVLLSVYYTPTPEQAYQSIEQINRDVPFGQIVRSVHHHSTTILVLFSLILSVQLLWQHHIQLKQWYPVFGLLVMVLLAAWTGRLLPQDVYALTSASVVRFGLTEAPLGKPIATLLGLNAPANVVLTHVFTLHSFVCGGTLLGVAFWLKGKFQVHAPWWHCGLYILMFTALLSVFGAPLSARVGGLGSSAWQGGPWWMFRFLHNWTEWFGAELTSYMIVGFVLLLTWLPFSTNAVNERARRIGIIVTVLFLLAGSF